MDEDGKNGGEKCENEWRRKATASDGAENLMFGWGTQKFGAGVSTAIQQLPRSLRLVSTGIFQSLLLDTRYTPGLNPWFSLRKKKKKKEKKITSSSNSGPIFFFFHFSIFKISISSFTNPPLPFSFAPPPPKLISDLIHFWYASGHQSRTFRSTIPCRRNGDLPYSTIHTYCTILIPRSPSATMELSRSYQSPKYSFEVQCMYIPPCLILRPTYLRCG